MKYSIEELKEKLNNLPEDVKDAIFSVETTEVIIGIQQKHKLHIDQAGMLAEEVGLVMLGLTRPYDFVSRIATKLRITQLTATQITKDINETIFNPIKESLKQIHSLDRTKDETKSTPSDTVDQTEVKTEPKIDSDQIFDQKLKGLFSSTQNESPKNDPYREPIN